LRRNQFGVAAGGPIKKDRTFIFGNYDGTRERRGVFRGARVPTPAEISGNLASLGKTIIDPTTKLPFPNNVIPANRIDPISAGLAQYYEAPNNPSGTVQNYVANLSSRDDADSFLMRVDHRLTNKHDLMSRYAPRIEKSTHPVRSLEWAARQSSKICEYCSGYALPHAKSAERGPSL
jgi:hypothetical protein